MQLEERLAKSSITTAQLRAIQTLLQGKQVIAAFSGGIDSALTLFFAKHYAQDVLAVTFNTELMIPHEISRAQAFCKTHEIQHEIRTISVLNSPAIAANTPDRCYHCKKTLFSQLIEEKEKLGYDFVIDGSNLSDQGEYRPGLKALGELQIISPLAHAEITKPQVIEAVKILALFPENVPSMACYASRIPYTLELTEELLQMIHRGESFLREQVLQTNAIQLRVRLHVLQTDNTPLYLARIETTPLGVEKIIRSPLQKEDLIASTLEDIGFAYVTLDLAGFVSGSLDKAISKTQEQKEQDE